MISNTVLDKMDIRSGEFRYFEQFAALMETDENLDYDTFAEIMYMADREYMEEMITSFFSDMISGIPDDDTELYRAIQEIKEPLVALSSSYDERAFRFLIDELFYLREWYTAENAVICTPEGEGKTLAVSPLDAFTLYRSEKLSMEKYSYDFTDHMPEPPGEHVLDIIEEMGLLYGNTDDYDDYNEYSLPDELPDDFDPTDYDPDSLSSGYIDPVRDGFVDRFNPVIDGEWEE